MISFVVTVWSFLFVSGLFMCRYVIGFLPPSDRSNWQDTIKHSFIHSLPHLSLKALISIPHLFATAALFNPIDRFDLRNHNHYPSNNYGTALRPPDTNRGNNLNFIIRPVTPFPSLQLAKYITHVYIPIRYTSHNIPQPPLNITPPLLLFFLLRR